MNREELDGWCERGIQGLVLAILLLGPLAFGAVDTVPFVAIEGLTILVCLLWAARFWINPRLQLLWPPINWVVIAFAIYTVIRYFNSEIEYLARGEMLTGGLLVLLMTPIDALDGTMARLREIGRAHV